MRTFKVGQDAIFVKNGIEVRVTIVGGANDLESVVIQTQDDNEPNMVVRKSELLPLKAPFFDIRGLVFTTSVKHPGEQGETIKRGKGIDGERFFCVQFRAILRRLAPHDLRRSSARSCHDAGAEAGADTAPLEHVSVQAIERYIGCKQHLRITVNDRLGIEPE